MPAIAIAAMTTAQATEAAMLKAGAAAGAKNILGLARDVGTGLQAYGVYQAQRTAQQQAKAQAAWNAYNAKVAQRAAEAEKEAAIFESKQAARRAQQLLSRQRALIGRAGVVPEGSPLLVAEDTAAQLAKEQTNIRLRGERRVSAFRGRSILDISKASAAKSRAAGFGRAAVIGAGTTLLQGGTQTAFMRGRMRGEF